MSLLSANADRRCQEVRGLDNMKINEKVGAWLLVKGNTKQGLASMLGISVSTLANRLDGSYGWSWEEACALAHVLNVSIAELE